MILSITDMDLQVGRPYVLMNGLTVKHPTIEEIWTLGEDNYEYLVRYLICLRPYDYMLPLDEAGKDWTTVTPFDVFLMAYDEENHKQLYDWLFMGNYHFSKASKDNQVVLYDFENKILIDRLVYEELSLVLSKMNFIKMAPDENPGNSIAKQFLLEEKRKEAEKAKRRKPKQQESQFSNYISFLAWNNTSGLTYDDIFKLNVFRFYEGLYRLLKTDRYKNTMIGYYTGNISGKDIKFDAIDWAGKLNIH